MKIDELSDGTGSVMLEATVDDVEEPRTFNKYGRTLTLTNVSLSDESGSITLTLWNDSASSVKKGDKVKIENGYVKSFQGKLQLTLGKFGKLTVL